MPEFLQGTSVVPTAAYFGHQGLGNVKGEAAPGQASIEDVAEMLFPRKAGGTGLAHTGTAPRAQGAEGGGPESVSLLMQPALEVGRGLGLRLPAVWMTYTTHTSRAKTFYKKDKRTIAKTHVRNLPGP
jgi:hypothetical protein